MSKFAIGSAMGFILGAAFMATSTGNQLRRDMRHTKCTMKRWARSAGVKL